MAKSPVLSSLRQAAPVVLPSLLLCDFGNLEREVRALEAAGVRALHLDVMDGNFVPNLTYGMPIVEGLRRLTDLPLDVHLMIQNPSQYVDAFVDAGADLMTVHIEAAGDPAAVLEQIHARGCAAGLVLNPGTPVEQLQPCLPACDLVLVMSVPAGFGGQPFDDSALDKLRWLREHGPADLLLEVDGGIKQETIGPCAAAGADLFVVGSAIFKTPDYGQAVASLTATAQTQRSAPPRWETH